jgi:LysM repeat protein
MAARRPARFLAPLALLAVVAALWMVLSHSSSNSTGGSGTQAGQQSTPPPAKKQHHKHHKRFYVVKTGDTPSGIAAATGVSLARIERLNPGLDPQALAPGRRLKLRP